jgi:hypothetical protein
VHHDFELEPEIMMRGTRPRKRTVAATAHSSTNACELGYAPLEVFDLWQRKLQLMHTWLAANADQASDVMEATVRLLSNRDSSAGGQLMSRTWVSMKGCGCDGRYTPQGAAQQGGSAARAGWGSEAEAQAAAAGKTGGYAAWLRERVSAAAETEINVQLGELTLKRHHMQLLESGVSKHARPHPHPSPKAEPRP